MALQQGVCIGFGRSRLHKDILPLRPWPFAHSPEEVEPTQFFLEAKDGDRLVLHLELQRFKWLGADTLMVVISESLDEKPVVVILDKDAISNGHITVQSYHCYHDQAKDFTIVQLDFCNLIPSLNSTTGSFPPKLWRDVGFFEVFVYRLIKAKGDGFGRTPKDLLRNVHFGMPKDIPRPPERSSGASDLKIRRVQTIQRKQNVNGYFLCGAPGHRSIRFLFHFRTPEWVAAWQKREVEELHTGIVRNRGRGLFALLDGDSQPQSEQQVTAGPSQARVATVIADLENAIYVDPESNRNSKRARTVARDVELDSTPINAGNVNEGTRPHGQSKPTAPIDISNLVRAPVNDAPTIVVNDNSAISVPEPRMPTPGVEASMGRAMTTMDMLKMLKPTKVGSAPNLPGTQDPPSTAPPNPVIHINEEVEAPPGTSTKTTTANKEDTVMVEGDQAIPSIEVSGNNNENDEVEHTIVPSSLTPDHDTMESEFTSPNPSMLGTDNELREKLASSPAPPTNPNSVTPFIAPGSKGEYTKKALSLRDSKSEVHNFRQVIQSITPLPAAENATSLPNGVSSSLASNTPTATHAIRRENYARRVAYEEVLSEMEISLDTSLLDTTERFIRHVQNEMDGLSFPHLEH